MTETREQHRVRLIGKSDRAQIVHDMARAMIEGAHAHGLFRSCLNCTHFDEPNELCRHHMFGANPQRPPARVIVTGCPEHTDTVPF